MHNFAKNTVYKDEKPYNHLAFKMAQVIKIKQFEKEHKPYFSLLSYREKEILYLLSKGMSNPGIAKKFDISRYTVQNHRRHIYKKLNINHYRDLYKYAWAFQLISFGTD